MYGRSFSVAVVSSLIASGAYFTYRGNPAKNGTSDLVATNSIQTSGLSTASALQSAGQATANVVEEVVEATRRALIIDGSQIYTGAISGDAPIEKTTDDQGRRVIEMMTPDQATQRIRRNEESFFVDRNKGVVRYDVVQLASNDPIEDDHAETIVEVPQTIAPSSSDSARNDWMFWGVFDGHSGWTTSAKLRQTLISYVARELNTTFSAASKATPSSPFPSPTAIDAAIKRGFVTLDYNIVHDSAKEVLKTQSKPKAASLLAPALSGSCALLSFYDTASQTLRVACTGDSRAILGRRSPQNPGKWTAMPLSVDQTAGEPGETARLRSEHPNEPNVVSAGRVLGGLEPSRAFGDASYKWSTDVSNRIHSDFFGRRNRAGIVTPPYVTAEPVITTTKVQPENGDFVVMATDGLWEMLSNEEVVGLVGQWLERHPQQNRSSPQSDTPSTDARSNAWLTSWFTPGKAQQNLPINHQNPGSDAGQRAPIRQKQWGLPPSGSDSEGAVTSDRFVLEDKNAATHLIRNALGGKDTDMMCALLTLPAPNSRRYRDDLTVEVIFFGEGQGAGEGVLRVNDEATKGGVDMEAVKAKL
ncbi:MAG: hypothetical protein M1828_007286 [Chrysothrix sp. TS-e1954]|nr:MAG: hypothetical protein M1828_007286 [Chrysothrix sp. TS-e1954]